MSVRLAVLLMCMASSPTFGVQDTAPVTLELTPLCARPRSYAPMIARIRLSPTVPHLLEGRLELRMSDPAGFSLVDLELPGIVLSGTVYETWIVIPPGRTPVSPLAEIDAYFVTEDERFHLSGARAESFLSLPTAAAGRRSLVVGMVTANNSSVASERTRQLRTELSFTRHIAAPVDELGQVAQIGRATCFVHGLVSADLPQRGLSYCAFDVLVLADEGFSRLKPRQLKAMQRWVQAGGRLCIVPDGPLEPDQVEFLRSVTAGADQTPVWAVGVTRELVSDLESPLTATYGLGRVGVLPSQKPLRLEQSQWRTFAGFLWGVRKGVAEQNANWTPLVEPAADSRWLESDWSAGTMDLRELNRGPLVQYLMPESVRMVPVWLIATVLIAYVLVVGPLDYLVLGWLRRRKYTWLVFPIVTAAFTISLIALSNHYLGTNETGDTLEINDVVQGGRIVRRTRISLEFFGSTRDVVDQVEGAFVAPMLVSSLFGYDSASPNAAGTRFSGRIPGNYTVARTVRQWEPRMQRTTKFVSERAPDFGFDWDALPSAGQLVRHSGEGELFVMRPDDERVRYGGYREIIRSITVRPARGLFGIVSSIAPTAAPNFEDLTLLDATDPAQRVVIVAVRDGDVLRVYRRHYKGNTSREEN